MEIKQGSDIKLNHKIGKGAFGEIFQGTVCQTHQQVAVKIEQLQCKTPQLFSEAKLYQLMHKDKNAKQNIPEVYYCSQEGNTRILVMQKLGPSLEDLFEACNRSFTLQTVLKIALQCLNRIEFIHAHNIIHRDVKPENFLVGLGEKTDKIFMIDFGLAKHFQVKGEDIIYKEQIGMTGTLRYSSLDAHLGKKQSKKDDLESLGYMFVYFQKGLPWKSDVNFTNKDEQFQKVLKMKEELEPKTICSNLKPEFSQYLETIRQYRPNDKPDYVDIFVQLLEKENLKLNDPFDWEQLATKDQI